MTEEQLVKIVLTVPAIRNMTDALESKKDSIKAILPIVLDEVVMSYGWDFACDEADYSGGTVADQATYVLTGNSNDCRAVVNIKYGSDLDLLDKMSQIDVDEWLTDRTQSAVAIWVPDGITRGFPQIKLVGAPSDAGDTIRYRYWKNNITVASFPNEWAGVLVAGIVKEMVPEYTPIYRMKLNDMMDNYNPAGGEDNPAKLDPIMVLRNNKRSRLFGWGGST